MRALARSCIVAFALIALIAAIAADRSASAGDGTGERVYIAAGSEVHYVRSTAPLPTRALGRLAVAAVDDLRADRPAAPDAEAPPGPATGSVLGAPAEGIPPAGWPHQPLGDEARAGRMPLGAVPAGKSACKCATSLGDESRERIAAVFASKRFRIGEEVGRLRVLRLRARFGDGLVAHLNGREVARRNLPLEPGPMEPAERPRGPEWETFYIPVVPGLVHQGDNLLTLEVRPSGRSLSPELDFELSGATGGARPIRGPIVQRVGRDAATVTFDTDTPARAHLEWGPSDAELPHRVESAGGGFAVHHEIALTGLPAGAPVHYRVVTDGAVSPTYAFHTTVAPNELVRFAVYGDVRGGHRVHAELVEALLHEAPDFVVATGDLVLRGSDEGDWQRFFEVTRELLPRIPYYPVAGNHDTGRTGDERRRMNEIFALWPGPADRPEWGHWYSFQVAGVHFVMLDSNSYEHPEQLAWLEQDLAAARAAGARAIFASAHDGPFSRGLHNGNQYAARHYAPILARHGVTLMFSGHDHLYQRGKAQGLAYLVSGGGGAPLYPVRCRGTCDDGMQHIAREYHYIIITVYPDHVESCPKRRDRTPLERCTTYRLPKR